MGKAELSDKALVADLLARSFDENSSVNYIVHQDDKRKVRIKSLMGYSFDVVLFLERMDSRRSEIVRIGIIP